MDTLNSYNEKIHERVQEKYKTKNINTLFFIWGCILTIICYLLLISYINIKNILSSCLLILLVTIVIFYILINLYN